MKITSFYMLPVIVVAGIIVEAGRPVPHADYLPVALAVPMANHIDKIARGEAEIRVIAVPDGTDPKELIGRVEGWSHEVMVDIPTNTLLRIAIMYTRHQTVIAISKAAVRAAIGLPNFLRAQSIMFSDMDAFADWSHDTNATYKDRITVL